MRGAGGVGKRREPRKTQKTRKGAGTLGRLAQRLLSEAVVAGVLIPSLTPECHPGFGAAKDRDPQRLIVGSVRGAAARGSPASSTLGVPVFAYGETGMTREGEDGRKPMPPPKTCVGTFCAMDLMAASFACRSGQLKVRPQGDRCAARRRRDLDLA